MDIIAEPGRAKATGNPEPNDIAIRIRNYGSKRYVHAFPMTHGRSHSSTQYWRGCYLELR